MTTIGTKVWVTILGLLAALVATVMLTLLARTSIANDKANLFKYPQHLCFTKSKDLPVRHDGTCIIQNTQARLVRYQPRANMYASVLQTCVNLKEDYGDVQLVMEHYTAYCVIHTENAHIILKRVLQQEKEQADQGG